jgi:AsmA-like C-terminal region
MSFRYLIGHAHLPKAMQTPTTKTNRAPRRWFFVAGLILLITIGLILAALSSHLAPLTRQWVIGALRERYDSDVEMGRFTVSFFPRIRATGEDVLFRHNGRKDVPPLISIKRFSADLGFLGLLSVPKRARTVRLEGLQIHVPPRGERGVTEHHPGKQGKSLPSFLVDEIIADGTFLEILPKKAGKLPLTFDISRLTLESVGADRPMSFRATLTNPKPPGQIQTTGEFGPWQKEDPSLTAVSGNFTFQNADLSVFRGISGTLSSEGKYHGVLERIEVQGSTDTPNFSVTISGHPVHLKTQYSAVVDGTNGDTRLEPVDARFLRSSVLADGKVAGTPGVKGKTVSLDVTVEKARVEDLLRLAVRSSKPVLTGVINFKTKFVLPPGDRDIAEKLNLDGDFGIGAARFTSLNLQQKVDALSRKGKGDTDDEDDSPESVASNFKGRFTLKNGIVSFSNLSFRVPGASVHLNGNYGLRSEQLDFRGTLQLEAKVSETTTGIKSFLLKAVDPLFKKKGAGAVLPITITGSREHPSFGLDIKRTLTRQ